MEKPVANYQRRSRFPEWFWWVNGIGAVVVVLALLAWAWTDARDLIAEAKRQQPAPTAADVQEDEPQLLVAPSERIQTPIRNTFEVSRSSLVERLQKLGFEVREERPRRVELTHPKVVMLDVVIGGAEQIEFVMLFGTSRFEGEDASLTFGLTVVAVHDAVAADVIGATELVSLIKRGIEIPNHDQTLARRDAFGDGVYITFKRGVIGSADVWVLVLWPEEPSDEHLAETKDPTKY